MKYSIAILAVIMLIFICYKYGRSIYMPLIHKVKGKETVASIVSKIEFQVNKRLEGELKLLGLDESYPEEILLLALKEEQILSIYSIENKEVQWIKDYPFTAYSGKLGPKLKEGDKQIPEGLYEVEYLNPNSAYYLSLKINYPNQFDQSKSRFSNLSEMGSNIFIHGKSATVGCIPIGDEAIEEIFLLSQKVTKKPVRVIVSPRDFRNNPVYPEIETIDWENELYDSINQVLVSLPRVN